MLCRDSPRLQQVTDEARQQVASREIGIECLEAFKQGAQLRNLPAARSVQATSACATSLPDSKSVHIRLARAHPAFSSLSSEMLLFNKGASFAPRLCSSKRSAATPTPCCCCCNGAAVGKHARLEVHVSQLRNSSTLNTCISAPAAAVHLIDCSAFQLCVLRALALADDATWPRNQRCRG